ncbi:MAG: putative surface protein with fasciclin (FAS1) repeats [Gammaproteobacteria bacterium]|jgi:uncharacterized surface protein with fasciclin (FAS1) repeats
MLGTAKIFLWAAATALTILGAAQAAHHDAKPVSSVDIVDTAVAVGSFNTLIAAVKAAGLVETLKSSGPFTVFAPTDEAFAKLPAGTVESLLKPENKARLVAILTYHVVPGKIMSGDIAGQRANVQTVEGQSLRVDATNGVRVDNATVTTADVGASNGVIHVIDTVMLPKI